MFGRKKRERAAASEGLVVPTTPGVTATPVDPGAPALVIGPLTPEWEHELAEMRAWIASCVADNDPPLDLTDPSTALAVIDALLERGGITAEDRWQLEALGVLLGDAMAAHVGVPWRLVTDQWGTVACLHLGRNDVVYPMSMIAKRVEAGEGIDLRRLFTVATEHMRELIAGH